jgi:hypothetical protein
VYFCYGRISNRMMLMRYGMSLEYNKYEHVHLKVAYLPMLVTRQCPELFEHLRACQISRFKRFKVKWAQFPVDLVTFCKATHWY